MVLAQRLLCISHFVLLTVALGLNAFSTGVQMVFFLLLFPVFCLASHHHSQRLTSVARAFR
jgi:hypothetical protein